MQNTHDIKTFFKDYPLYKAFIYTEDYLNLKEAVVDPFDFHGLSFEYYCPEEQSNKTFELDLPEPIKAYYGEQADVEIPSECFDDKKHLNYDLHLLGICKSCKKKQADFLVNIKSDQVFPKRRLDLLKSFKIFTPNQPEVDTPKITVFMTKIGVAPESEVKVDPVIQKYFDRETNNWYYKGIKLYSQNFGIGAFAYFRRIVEKELLEILKNIGELSSADPKLRRLVEDFDKNAKISSLYENSFSLLPKSLQILGDNPFEILYRLTSQGLHHISEQECIDKADKVHKLLDFVIKKINEEKSELLEIRNIIKDLKK